MVDLVGTPDCGFSHAVPQITSYYESERRGIYVYMYHADLEVS